MSRPSRLPARTPAGPLAGAIASRLRELGMPPVHLAERMGGQTEGRSTSGARSQVSRLLSGATAHPSLDTYLLLCRALRTDPTELAVRAGLWDDQGPDDRGLQ